MTVNEAAGWLALLLSASSLITTWYKTRPEVRKTISEAKASDGESAENFSKAAETYAAQVVKLQERLSASEDVHTERTQILLGRIGEVEKELVKIRDENEDLRDWAERLVHQVRSLGHEPVKMRAKGARV